MAADTTVGPEGSPTLETPCREYPVRFPSGYGRRRDLEPAHRWVVRVVGEDRFGTAWESDLHVMHLCDNPPCCRYDHLRLGTHQDNQADKRLKRRGRGPARRLSSEQVVTIRKRVAAGEPMALVARDFQVNARTVRRIVLDETYRNVGGPRRHESTHKQKETTQ